MRDLLRPGAPGTSNGTYARHPQAKQWIEDYFVYNTWRTLIRCYCFHLFKVDEVDVDADALCLRDSLKYGGKAPRWWNIVDAPW